MQLHLHHIVYMGVTLNYYLKTSIKQQKRAPGFLFGGCIYQHLSYREHVMCANIRHNVQVFSVLVH